MMSDRRSVIAPPEMTNGSTSGRVSSNSSIRAARTRHHVEEVQFTVARLERPGRRHLQHAGEHPLPRMEKQGVQGPRRAGAVRGRVFLERQRLRPVYFDAIGAFQLAHYSQALLISWSVILTGGCFLLLLVD